MTKTPTTAPAKTTAARASAARTQTGDPAVERWAPPASDQEFVFEGIDSAPGWVDRNWAGYDMGPALQLPAGDIWGKPPYTTKVARIGDKVMFIATKGATPAHFEVIRGEPAVDSGLGTLKIPQVTNASLEDLLKTGNMAVGDLGVDAAAQVAMRSPELAQHIESGTEIAPATELPVKVD